LAEEIGFGIEVRPLTFTTVTNKMLVPQVTQEFHIKVKLVEEHINNVKLYDFKTRYRLVNLLFIYYSFNINTINYIFTI
ncbi:hypothetical protein H8356DRAFT_948129, partial [Neocallimastix lanati (nom. inval.)]